MGIMEAIGITMTTRERNSVMGETRAVKTTPDNDVESVTIFLFMAESLFAFCDLRHFMPGEGDCDKDRDCERGLVRLNLMWKNNSKKPVT